jgi:hypothetical protein
VRQRRLVHVCVLVATVLLGCGRHAERAGPPAAKVTPPTPEPTPLLTLSGSAYAATLALDDEGSYLLTGDAAYRLVPGRTPERWGLDLGASPALMRDRLLYWSNGAFRQAPKRGGEPTVLAVVPHPPQRVVTSGDHVAWLDQAEDGRFTIQTLDGSRTRIVHAPRGYVAALAMEDDRIYFVEQAGTTWSLGVVSLSGGSARHTSTKTGRTPAMLAVAHDVFYYDGPSLTVRRVSSDLEREDVIARDVICSPIAVAERAYCAQPTGLVELDLDGGSRRPLRLGQRGTITAISASATQLVWLMDVGRGQLAVETIALTSPRS